MGKDEENTIDEEDELDELFKPSRNATLSILEECSITDDDLLESF